jgi:hypothetical protein
MNFASDSTARRTSLLPCGGRRKVQTAGEQPNRLRHAWPNLRPDRPLQQMVDGPHEYKITGKPYSEVISVAPVSGKFGADGSGTSAVEIKVADSVRDGYYPLVLTTKAGKGDRTFMLLNVVGELRVAEAGGSDGLSTRRCC